MAVSLQYGDYPWIKELTMKQMKYMWTRLKSELVRHSLHKGLPHGKVAGDLAAAHRRVHDLIQKDASLEARCVQVSHWPALLCASCNVMSN